MRKRAQSIAASSITASLALASVFIFALAMLSAPGSVVLAADLAQDIPTVEPSPEVTPTLSVAEPKAPVAVDTPEPTATPTATPAPLPPQAVLKQDEILTGTIIANRSDSDVTFFLDGKLFELPPFRATGIDLRRPLSVLNLFNCPAGSEETEACFWDPYPVRQDGFYEVKNGAEEGKPVSLVLQEASAPPTNQIWLQNRTGHTEQILYGTALFEADNTTVLEITLAEGDDAPQIYLRHCLSLAGDTVCEWLPQPVIGGVYYSLVEKTSPGATPGSASIRVVSEPVISQPGVELVVSTPEPEILKISCQIQVPTLNVRSGPGVQYLVTGRLRQADESGGKVLVVGRTEDNEWLAVDPEIVDGGWVIHNERFLICQDDTTPLPVTEITDGRLAPTPTPIPAAAEPSEGQPAEAPPEAAQPAPPAIPEGRALLIVTNTFDKVIRFTLSPQEHDLPPGTPAEHDLQPGDSIQLLIGAGRVRFSASSPFRNSSGNAEFVIKSGESRELFLHFVPSEDNPNKWELRF
jgi:hypothetical protein